jgi:hypothetical protein
MSSAVASPVAAKVVAKRVVAKKEEVAAAVAPVVAPSVKTVTKKTAAPTASVPAVAAVAAPVPEVKVAKAKAVKAEVAAPAVVAAPVATDASGAVVAEVEEEKLEKKVKDLTARMVKMREDLSELISESKRLEKAAAKVQKVADKRRRRKAPVEGEEAKPARISIFQIPTAITPALCAFLGKPVGHLESRSNVTKFITAYVKEHNLMNKHDINGDAKLMTLLGLKQGDKLTYFNLQKYLNVHYIKNVPAVAATATATATA